MEFIESASNPKIKLVRKLSDKKFRKEEGLFVAEGVNILKDMPKSAQVTGFFVEKSKAEELRYVYERFDAPVYAVTESVFKTLSDTVTPSGILATIKMPENAVEKRGNAVVLDGVSDPGNLGTIMRSAAAFGFCTLYLVGCADPYDNKAVRSSMGGVFRLSILKKTAGEMKEVLKNYYTVALDMGGEPLRKIDTDKNIAVIAGNEAHGVSDEMLGLSDVVMSMKMVNDMESLNVAVACGVAMYNLAVL